MKKRNKKLLITTILIFALVFRTSIPVYAKYSDASHQISVQEVTGYTLLELFGFVITPQTIMIISIIILLFIVSWLYSRKKHYKDYYDLYKSLYDNLNAMHTNVENDLFNNQQIVKGLKAWKADACEVYPDIETQIAELHAAKEGAAFSEKYRITIPSAYLEAMLRDYNNLPDAAKKYADFNPDTAQRNLDVLKTK